MRIAGLFALAVAVSAAADPLARCRPSANTTNASSSAVADLPTGSGASATTAGESDPRPTLTAGGRNATGTPAPAESAATRTVQASEPATTTGTLPFVSLTVASTRTRRATTTLATNSNRDSSTAAPAPAPEAAIRTASASSTQSSKAHRRTRTRTRAVTTAAATTAAATRATSRVIVTTPSAVATTAPVPTAKSLPPPSSGNVCTLPAHAATADIGPLMTALYTSCVKPKPGSTLLIPRGAHSLQTNVIFDKPVPFTLRIDGDIDIPFNPKLGGTLLHFTRCTGITVTGTGSIHGNGNLWREGRNLSRFPGRPRLLRLERCDNSLISDLRFINAAKFHITVIGDNNEIRNIDIKADNIGETDGIDISGNNNYVHDVSVENGDECVTVKSPTTNFKAENIICKATAGCNIGSFGPVGGTAAIDGVYYRNVTMISSSAGVMLKSYPSTTGYVRNIVYEDFTLTDVAYPIDLDMEWCHGPCPPMTGTLKVTKATFKNFVVAGSSGSSRRPVVKLNCPLGAPAAPGCEDVKICGMDRAKTRGYAKDIIVNAAHSMDC
ncbi:hypothetical protein HDU86_003805 [Geranomyces michiganensis]|nr:hypothetical protein HDU86_003805 [Geranomyces michiganensis]